MSSVDEIETVTPSDASGGDASYFRVLHAYRVLLCTACGACYVRGNYQRHLLEVHRVKGRRKRASRPAWRRWCGRPTARRASTACASTTAGAATSAAAPR